MSKLSQKEEIELSILAFGIKYWLFTSGVFLGQAMSVFTIDLVIGRLTPLSLMGVFFLAASLGSYQYKGHLSNKLTALIAKEQNNE